MDERWRWGLVDELANGLGFAPLYQEYPEDLQEANLEREVELAKGSQDEAVLMRVKKLLDTKVSLMFRRFNRDERREMLTVPRFDLADLAFMKSDIPDEIENYLKTLPALSIPFDTFWVEWVIKPEGEDMKIATQVVAEPMGEDGRMVRILTYMDTPVRGRRPGEERVAMRVEADLRLGADSKPLGLGGNAKERVWAVPVIHLMALLSCRNVTTEEVSAPRQIRRQIMRTHGVALCSYRIIHIKHFGRRKRVGEVDPEHKPVEGRAMSICRGHFKTFDDKGLFGKLKGTWWWEGHVRGDYEYGSVSKDYRVEAGE